MRCEVSVWRWGVGVEMRCEKVRCEEVRVCGDEV